MGTSKIIGFGYANLVFLCGINSAFAGVETIERRDSIVSIAGTVAPGLKISFGETIYLAANVLDPMCLLQFPDGGFGLVTESYVSDPEIQADGSFKIDFNINHFKEISPCQFQFGMIKLWFETETQDVLTSEDNFVALLPEGAQYEGHPVKRAKDIQNIECASTGAANGAPEKLNCVFNYANVQSKVSAVPKSGLTISGLEIGKK